MRKRIKRTMRDKIGVIRLKGGKGGEVTYDEPKGTNRGSKAS